MQLWQGDVFTPVCQSFCFQRVSATHTPGRHAPTPGQTHPLGRHPWADTPLGRHPPGQTPLGRWPPWADTPQQQTPPGRHIPRQTPPRQTPQGRHPLPSAWWDTQSPLLPSAYWDTPPYAVHAGIGSISGRYASYWNTYLRKCRFRWINFFQLWLTTNIDKESKLLTPSNGFEQYQG